VTLIVVRILARYDLQAMSYFPDLTRYTHGRDDAIEGGGQDLRVGWLQSGHEFARGDAPAGLVDALVLCATRPVRLMKGFHECDLCPSVSRHEMRIASMDLDGRRLKLGNGEVRVRAPDGRWYTAPTLVAHYVAAHGYLPPAPFVGAVLRRAMEFYSLTGVQLSRLTALSIDDQLDVCIRAIAAFPTREPTALAAVCTQLRMRDDATLHQMDEMDALSDEVADACLTTSDAFSCSEPLTDDERQSRARACLIYVLELASDLGIDAAAF
jgi:hypothetical protein